MTWEGKLTTSPELIDTAVRAAWEPVYAGNLQDALTSAQNFAHTYETFMFRKRRVKLLPIMPAQVRSVVDSAPESAPGLDGWTAGDLRGAPPILRELLAEFFQAVEKGHPWPEVLVQTRSVMLPKTDNVSFEPI